MRDNIADTDLERVGEALRASVSAGEPGAAVIGAWRSLSATDPQWQALLKEITEAAGQLHPTVGMAASIHPEAVAAATVDLRGEVLQADARFRAWVGDPSESIECRRLIGEAAAGRPAIGLAPTRDDSVISIFAQLSGRSGAWARLADAPAAGGRPRDTVLLVAFAPTRSAALASRAATAFGLTPLETKVAEAMLDAPNLAIAARSIGVGRATAKDALERGMRKAGVRRSAEFVGRMIDISCVAGLKERADLRTLMQALGLTPGEIRVAVAVADGREASQIARDLGLAEETVKSYRRSIFRKTGVNRARDLRRILSEVATLDQLAAAAEIVADHNDRHERLKVTIYDGRRVAYVDYGPASGVPLVVCHGFTTGRLAPPPVLAQMHGRGFRVLIPQRPGFGLTDPASGDYLETAANDLAAILDSLGLDRVRVLARDGGAAVILAFAGRHPDRLDRPVLLNPRSPRGARPPPAAPMSAISRFLLDRPALIQPFAEMLRRQTRSEALEGMLRRACSAAECDRTVIEDPAVLAHLVRDAQGLMARSVRGFVDEQEVYSRGWSPAGVGPAGTWTIGYSGALNPDPDVRPWAGLPGLKTVVIGGAGVLAAYTHTQELLALLG